MYLGHTLFLLLSVMIFRYASYCENLHFLLNCVLSARLIASGTDVSVAQKKRRAIRRNCIGIDQEELQPGGSRPLLTKYHTGKVIFPLS